MDFKIKKIKPLFTGVITTAYEFKGEGIRESGIIDINKMDGNMNPYQWVKAVGDMVHNVKPGDIVFIDFRRYKAVQHLPGDVGIENNVQRDKMQSHYAYPKFEIDGEQCLFLQNNDLVFVVEEADIPEGGLLQ